MGATLLGVRDRGDLSRSVIVLAGAAGIVVSTFLSALMHRKAGVPFLHKWDLSNRPTTKILSGLLSLAAVFMVFYGLDAIFPQALTNAKCSTGKCIGAAINFGSNLYAAVLIWSSAFLISILGTMGVLLAKELFLRAFTLIRGR